MLRVAITGVVVTEVNTRVEPERNGKSVGVVATEDAPVAPKLEVRSVPVADSALVGKLMITVESGTAESKLLVGRLNGNNGKRK